MRIMNKNRRASTIWSADGRTDIHQTNRLSITSAISYGCKKKKQTEKPFSMFKQMSYLCQLNNYTVYWLFP